MTTPLEIVITMGGLGSRFKDKGYTVPKYMIPARGKTLFEWSLLSLQGFAAQVCQYIFIVLKTPGIDCAAFIQEKCTALHIKSYKIHFIEQLTDGQATTALFARNYWHPQHALLIYNIDTYVEPGAMNSAQLCGDGFIPCFQAPGDHWSFVRLDQHQQVVEVKEKQRISNHCTLGAYYFKNCQLFEQLYSTFYTSYTGPQEKYVAPLYNQLLKQGGRIFITDIPSSKVHVLGTPEELEVFLQNKPTAGS